MPPYTILHRFTLLDIINYNSRVLIRFLTPLQITHPLWPPLPLSLMATLDYASTLTTTSTFTRSHFGLYTHFDHQFHFHTWPLQIAHPLWPPLPFCTLPLWITHPLWPPLPFLYIATLDNTPTLTTNSIFIHSHFRLHTHVDHHFHFHTWTLLITHPLWPPLPPSYMATSYYTPTLTTTSIFRHSHFRLHTHVDHHFHLHT